MGMFIKIFRKLLLFIAVANIHPIFYFFSGGGPLTRPAYAFDHIDFGQRGLVHRPDPRVTFAADSPLSPSPTYGG